MTAYIILATAVLSLVAAVGAAVRSWQNSRKLTEIHIVMNSRLTDALSRIEQLSNSLQESGIIIPDDPNLKSK